MSACYCTGACRQSGVCPNIARPFPGTWPNQVYPHRPPTSAQPQAPIVQPSIVVRTGPSEERIREIIREELERAKDKP